MTFKEQVKKYFEMEWSRHLLTSKEGFIFYEIREKELFISDLFVEEKYQGTGKALKLAQEIEEVARKENCGFITCFLSCGQGRIHSATELLRKYINFGFNILKAENEIVTMIKFIEKKKEEEEEEK